MASSRKTPKLNLNSWTAQDKPKRVDFVEDNTIIDEKLGDHLEDTNVHLSTEDREKLNSIIYTLSYSGTGTSTRNITFPFVPSLVIVYKRFDSFTKYDSTLSCTKINGAFFSKNEPTDDCGTLSGTVLTVKQSSAVEDGIFNNLNEQYGQYVAVAFR